MVREAPDRARAAGAPDEAVVTLMLPPDLRAGQVTPARRGTSELVATVGLDVVVDLFRGPVENRLRVTAGNDVLRGLLERRRNERVRRRRRAQDWVLLRELQEDLVFAARGE